MMQLSVSISVLLITLHTALSQICPSLGSHAMPLNLFLICLVLPCVRSRDTAHQTLLSDTQTTAGQI